MSQLSNSPQAEILPEGIMAELPEQLLQKGFGDESQGKAWLFPEEALFLVEIDKLIVLKQGEPFEKGPLRTYFESSNPGFFLRYIVYKDLRTKGYVAKSGAKYGMDFRLYDKGVKPKRGKKEDWEHAKFVVQVMKEDDVLSVKGLVGLNRISHSVKKTLWIAMVDKDLGTTYIQVSRLIP
ncbi:MAG: tRNA-intron lyase [Candidatus Altiarchaeota archaeon]|nr:tRNA-intron lyase [Candidatus Altiarchaeota archaeon]